MLKSKKIVLAMICLSLVLLSACGSTGSTGFTSSARSTDSNANSATQPKELKSVTISEPTRTLSFAPVYVALSKGFFEKEGVKVNLISGGGGAQVLATLISEAVQLSAAPTISFFTLLEKSQDLLAVSSFNKGAQMQTIVSNQFLEKKGIKPDAPVKEKLAALKGAKMGAIVLGSAQELYLKYNMLLAGLNPDDIIVTSTGDANATLAAMKQGIIDGTIFGAPVAQQAEEKNIGKLFINVTELKEYENMDTEWLFGTRKWIEANPETTRSLVKGLGEALALLRDQPADAAKAIQPYFEGVDVKLLEKGIVDMKSLFQGNGTMTEESMQKALKSLLDLKSVSKISKQFDLKENVIWTNKYISK